MTGLSDIGRQSWMAPAISSGIARLDEPTMIVSAS